MLTGGNSQLSLGWVLQLISISGSPRKFVLNVSQLVCWLSFAQLAGTSLKAPCTLIYSVAIYLILAVVVHSTNLYLPVYVMYTCRAD